MPIVSHLNDHEYFLLPENEPLLDRTTGFQDLTNYGASLSLPGVVSEGFGCLALTEAYLLPKDLHLIFEVSIQASPLSANPD